jgi:hypothetical protein
MTPLGERFDCKKWMTTIHLQAPAGSSAWRSSLLHELSISSSVMDDWTPTAINANCT